MIQQSRSRTMARTRTNTFLHACVFATAAAACQAAAWWDDGPHYPEPDPYQHPYQHPYHDPFPVQCIPTSDPDRLALYECLTPGYALCRDGYMFGIDRTDGFVKLWDPYGKVVWKKFEHTSKFCIGEKGGAGGYHHHDMSAYYGWYGPDVPFIYVGTTFYKAWLHCAGVGRDDKDALLKIADVSDHTGVAVKFRKGPGYENALWWITQYGATGMDHGCSWYFDVIYERGLFVDVYDDPTSSLGNPPNNVFDPITNLLDNETPSNGEPYILPGTIDYELFNFPKFQADYPALTDPNLFVIRWYGGVVVSEFDDLEWTFGTKSDDGSVVYVDLNGDGQYDSTSDELVVEQNKIQRVTAKTGTVTFPGPGCYNIFFAFFDFLVAETVEVKYAKEIQPNFSQLAFVDGSDPNSPFVLEC
mmetsp:Transcript_23375/g.50700  ORF Transcript_23375/g.50700 Transcript_23375/m.50700 type:complete len:415 (+) Transcript_23375:59-1303(+)